jgi:hypothetical protein
MPVVTYSAVTSGELSTKAELEIEVTTVPDWVTTGGAEFGVL